MSSFFDYVRGLTDVVPEGYSRQGMAVYRHHVYLAASQMMAASYPALKAALNDDDWRLLLQDFIAQTRWTSHFYAELTNNFESYLANALRQDTP